MKKELKSGILSADKSADGRPTVFLVNVIAVFVLDLVGNPEDRLSHNTANFIFLLADVSVVFSGYSRFAPPTDWARLDMSEIILKGTLN